VGRNGTGNCNDPAAGGRIANPWRLSRSVLSLNRLHAVAGSRPFVTCNLLYGLRDFPVPGYPLARFPAFLRNSLSLKNEAGELALPGKSFVLESAYC
jgi:hypothetical protein